MRNFVVVLLLSVVAPSLAEAHPRHGRPPRVVVVGPRVGVVVSPWAFGYRPAPRPGWLWVEGHYDAGGAWIPGYWAPAGGRPGWVWVPGHWEGETYIEGEWRAERREGFVWVEGHYDHGRWVPGYWQAEPPPSEPPGKEKGEDPPLAIPAE